MSRLVFILLCVAIAASCAERRVPSATPSARAEAGAAQPSDRIRLLVPAPASVEPLDGAPFVVTPATRVLVSADDPELLRIGRSLAAFIGPAAGPTPPAVETAEAAPAPGHIRLALGRIASAGDDAYELTVAAEGVTIAANRPQGLFHGVQTLRQLLPVFVEYEAVGANEARPVTVAAVRIADAPRFAWRGAMLDVSRHFVRVPDVKRYLDLMALYKLNRLHLHLSDDQGWRVEITSWPNLTARGGSTQVGGGPGGFYTQAEYTDLVAYARDRFVTIVPEIDLPGHTNAALASYAELNCDGVAPPLYTGTEVGFSTLCVEKDVTYEFLDDVVREIAAMTSGPYFHIGGDEVEKLTPGQYAQFIERVQQIVRTHGKQVVGWGEIAAANLLPDTIVQHWRPENVPTLAVSKGAKVVLSPANRVYLDMKYDAGTALGLNWAGFVGVRDAYEWDPITTFEGLEEASVLGVEAPLWSETLVHLRDFEHMAFPRLAGVAEIGWSRADRRSWDDYRVRLGAQGARWAALGINYYRAPDIPWVHR